MSTIPEMTECIGTADGQSCASAAQHPEYTGMLRANSEAWLLPGWHPVWTTCGCGNLGYFVCPDCLRSWGPVRLEDLNRRCDVCSGFRLPNP